MENKVPANANITQAVPFFMVADMETSIRFYTQCLGFTITKTWIPDNQIEWCWLERDGAALMLQRWRKPSTDKKGAGVSICFQCVDALALYHEFTAKGLTLAEPFVGNSMWVVILTDPDGYKLDFESFTDVPEETKYSEWASK